MNNLALPLIICLVSLVINLKADMASATPRGYQEALREANQLRSAKRSLERKIKGLSKSEKARLKSKFRGTDSDRDGVADEIELGLKTGLCESDSDRDGIDDGADDHENEDDSNSDGQPDGDNGQEFEIKGEIGSFTDPLLVINGRDFTLTERTEFRGRGFDRGDLRSGLCVELDGRIDQGLNLVDIIKIDDDC
jgi:hypothetical protein